MEADKGDGAEDVAHDRSKDEEEIAGAALGVFAVDTTGGAAQVVASAPGPGALLGSLLGRAAQFGTVVAAYAYFLGWSFFSNALQRFHVDAEEIGVTPAWLLVRLVPVAIVIAVTTGVFYALIAQGRARAQLLAVGEGVLGAGLAIGILWGLSIGVNAAVHLLFGSTLPIPSYQGISRLNVDLIELWWQMALSTTIISIATAYIFALAFDPRARATLSSVIRKQLMSGSPSGDAGSGPSDPNAAKDTVFGRLLSSPNPRTNILVLSGLFVALTFIAYESVAAAGHSLGSYIAKGHSANFEPMIDWPAVLVAEHGSQRCMVQLGLSQDTFVLYYASSASVTFVPTDDADVSVPSKGCATKARR